MRISSFSRRQDVAEFIVTAERSPDWDDAKVRRRLGRAYRIILDSRTKETTADRGEFGDLTRTAEEATAPHEAVPS
jgi:hypothetical protein